MQEMTAEQANIILSKNQVGASAPIFYADIGGKTDIKITSFSMSREHGAMAQNCSLTIANVNPTDPSDTGYYNEGRNDSANNKPSNAYNGIIIPGGLISVKMGYGDSATLDTVPIFTGSIDTVKISMSGNNSQINIQCRGTTKKMVDNPIQCDRVVSGEIFYHINYPINGWAASGEELTEFYLKVADTNPLLLSIWIDACERAGYSAGNIVYDIAWTTRLNDVAEGSFTNCTGSWIQLAQKVVDLLGAYMYEGEEGKVYLKVANNQVNAGADTISMTGTSWHALEDGGYARAIKESIVVVDFSETFIIDVDYEFDYATNSIRRIDGGGITAGQGVDVTYTYCAWKFNPTQVYQLDQYVSHDETYGLLVATNNELTLKRDLTTGALGDGSSMSTLKALVEDKPELTTNAQLDAYLASKMVEMKKNYFNLHLNCIAIPHLRVRDIICCVLFGTVTSLYEIIGFNITYDASSGMSQTIDSVYYGSSGAV